MFKMEIVPISKIKPRKPITRFCGRRADLKELRENIRINGLKNPIVVGTDYRIIDGQIRFNAMKDLGFTEITVIIKDF